MANATHTFTRCGHPPDTVTADILSGALDGLAGGHAVEWCQICGAYRFSFNDRTGEWNLPAGPDGEGIKFR